MSHSFLVNFHLATQKVHSFLLERVPRELDHPFEALGHPWDLVIGCHFFVALKFFLKLFYDQILDVIQLPLVLFKLDLDEIKGLLKMLDVFLGVLFVFLLPLSATDGSWGCVLFLSWLDPRVV